jgi:hypothetical protein
MKKFCEYHNTLAYSVTKEISFINMNTWLNVYSQEGEKVDWIETGQEQNKEQIVSSFAFTFRQWLNVLLGAITSNTMTRSITTPCILDLMEQNALKM